MLIDHFLEDAIEVDVDALSDGEDVVIGGIMQHIEEAGIHSGDSSCVLPAVDIPEHLLNRMRDYTFKLARALQGGWADEYSVRDPSNPESAKGNGGRVSLRARSEPARLAHRAVRVEGDGRADGEDCRAPDDRTQAARVPAGEHRRRQQISIRAAATM